MYYKKLVILQNYYTLKILTLIPILDSVVVRENFALSYADNSFKDATGIFQTRIFEIEVIRFDIVTSEYTHPFLGF